MEETIYAWTPKLIVELVSVLVWPLTVIIIGIKFRSGISDVISNFFTRNRVSELSATTSGLSAKFVAEKQSSEIKESATSSSINLPDTMSSEAIKKRHEDYKTEFSVELYNAIKSHLAALNLPQEEQIEILAKEVALYQSALRYFDINKVLFRSQYNLFNIMRQNNGEISKESAKNNFEEVKRFVGEAFAEWDWVKYIAFPVSSGLITDSGDTYNLTPIGNSYVAYMSKNPQLIDDLAKL
ncbi:hypothetical protein E5N72_11350 [Pseudoalteromonas sp. MEBiC 03607]|uniref:hypothetical protein n=1 Tax=Pseudoalteromonas sp. MEBiC 03607 TaxID=2563601 RepID=UPI001093C181|nr:hypothetical protein [Pseudoalteromonas sp. MEBiC 03607]TGV20637.1 hypothetical protein E5N72_11350 [Pseudoalteromonas sp. MEBiC 03607]